MRCLARVDAPARGHTCSSLRAHTEEYEDTSQCKVTARVHAAPRSSARWCALVDARRGFVLVLVLAQQGVVSALTCFSSGSNTKQRGGALSSMRDAARMLALEPGGESSAAHVQFGWALADKSDGLWQYLVKRKMLDGNARECSSICPLILLYMCPHTPLYVPSYCRICFLILLYMCPHTAVYVPSYCCCRPARQTVDRHSRMS